MITSQPLRPTTSQHHFDRVCKVLLYIRSAIHLPPWYLMQPSEMLRKHAVGLYVVSDMRCVIELNGLQTSPMLVCRALFHKRWLRVLAKVGVTCTALCLYCLSVHSYVRRTSKRDSV
jgi:hypothetical protein